MPQTMVKETQVYTLAELQDSFGYSVYEKAIENVTTWVWDGFEAENVTDDLVYIIGEDFPLFELGQTRERHGNKERYRPNLFWDMDRNTAEAKGAVAVARFMTELKLCNKYRLLWAIMRKHGLDLDAPVAFGSGRADNADLSDLHSNIEYCDETVYKSPRGQKIEAQITALEGEIEGYVTQIYSAVLKQLRAENDYRCSEEFAKEEAESQEFQFTQSGSIYHG